MSPLIMLLLLLLLPMSAYCFCFTTPTTTPCSFSRRHINNKGLLVRRAPNDDDSPHSIAELKILLVDHYDSYTYNLYNMLLQQQSCQVTVITKDFDGVLPNDMDGIVLSPGPGRPGNNTDLGRTLEIIKHYSSDDSIPILGVCLGHQALGYAHGASIVECETPVHGQVHSIELLNNGDLWKGIMNGTTTDGTINDDATTMNVTRYHSLKVQQDLNGTDLIATATYHDDETHETVIMGLQHKTKPLYGVQFHPESIGTPQGHLIVDNFLNICQEQQQQRNSAAEEEPHRIIEQHQERRATHHDASSSLENPQQSSSPPLHGEQQHKTPLFVSTTTLNNVDATPTQVFERFYSKHSHAIWLDSSSASSASSSSQARYSIMGAMTGPLSKRIEYYGVEHEQQQQQRRGVYVTTMTNSEHVATVQEGDEQEDILDYLQRQQERYQLIYNDDGVAKSLPFVGGHLGYLGYEVRHDTQRKLDGTTTSTTSSSSATTTTNPNVPTAAFLFCDQTILYDHQTNQWHLVELTTEHAPTAGATSTDDDATTVNGHDDSNNVAAAAAVNGDTTNGAANGSDTANGDATNGATNGSVVNGDANGDANSYTAVNGAITNGVTNGSAVVNGATNGATNGSTAAVNGNANGATNGSTAAAINGNANGVTNGSTADVNGNANGATNGSTAAVNGNANGVTKGSAAAAINGNANGATNGSADNVASNGAIANGSAAMSDWRRHTEQVMRQLAHDDEPLAQHHDTQHSRKQQQQQLSFVPNRSRQTYQADIDNCHTQIKRGESYELCLTNQLETTVDNNNNREPWGLYKILRDCNPAPFAAFVNWQGGKDDDDASRNAKLAICCSSPERFVSIQPNDDNDEMIVEAKPIKGTAARPLNNKNAVLDQEIAHALQHDVKNRAENLMIVDLLRNDLHRVCKNVHVPKLMAIESYATVHQLVSTIRGTLDDSSNGPVDVLTACFPGGSMTGAPKRRTMELLHDMEQEVCRGPYSGCLGYIGLGGRMDMNIVIRSAVLTPKEDDDSWKVSIGAGGAITALSESDDEYEEMLLKARAIQKAVELWAMSEDDETYNDVVSQSNGISAAPSLMIDNSKIGDLPPSNGRLVANPVGANGFRRKSTNANV